MKPILPQIKCPKDLVPLSDKELGGLCGEIREKIIEVVSENGGHLASNLGTVELTCCLERVFCEPEDKIVFDVGHQCYTHKIITGRADSFSTLRKKGGISGFPKPSESPYDPFVAGHSSTAVSVALGLADAKRLAGETGSVIAVVGDGAMTGGMCYEALNNVSESDAKVIIVINDNEMSISPNVGGISRHLAKITTQGGYFRFKDGIKKFLLAIPLIGKWLFNRAVSFRNFFKRVFIRSNMFSDMGLYYMGPVNGHDIKQLTDVFKRAKKLDRSVAILCNTVKGKGFTPAENSPVEFHSTAPFVIEKAGNGAASGPSFSAAFGDELVCLAEKEPRICAITASMCDGVGLSTFKHKFPDRCFDVGIAEQHAVTFTGALSAGGRLPFFAVYSSFLQRGFDQLIHDVAIGGLHAVFCIDRAGFVGEDGQTHCGMMDVAYISCIPGFTLYSPSSFEELRLCMRAAVAADGPVAIRYPRGSEGKRCAAQKPSTDYLRIGEGGDILLCGYGRQTEQLFNAYDLLLKQGIKADILKLTKLSPLSDDIVSIAKEYPHIVFAEEAVSGGSVGEKTAKMLLESGYRGSYKHICADGFAAQDSVLGQLTSVRLDAQSIATETMRILGGERNQT